MTSEEAFDTIRKAVGAHPRKRIVESSFDQENFGNFFISFEDDEQQRSIVNDRGELVICHGLEGTCDCTLVLPTLYDVDERALLRALKF